MKLRRHYMTLRRSFPDSQEGVPFEVTTQELAEALECTHRNMVMVLKRMGEEGWIGWEPRRGRGNRSLLTFLASEDSLALMEAQELVHKQDLRSALTLLQQPESSPQLRGQFQNWLSGQFGFRTEVKDRRRLDVLRFPLAQSISTLDPAAIHYIGESHLVNQLFDSLVRMDPKGNAIMPHLAHAWDVSEDRKEWTFYLRKGVLFHHGREMSSSDVLYSLRRLQRLAPAGLYSWVYNDIADMQAPDDTTIWIRLRERNEAFLSFLSTNRSSIVPEDACEAEGERFGSRPVGTGPFRLNDSEQGIWILEAHAGYFQGRAFLDRVEIWALPDGGDASASQEHATATPGQTAEAAAHGLSIETAGHGQSEEERGRTFQVMHNVRASDLSGTEWQQVRQSGTTSKFITINELKQGPLANPAVREAVDRALQRSKLLKRIPGDAVEETSSFLLHGKGKGGSDGRGVKDNRKKIIRSLAEAGYEGEPLVLATIPQYAADAELIRELLERVEVPVEIRLMKAEQFKGEARMSADMLLFAILLDEHRELRLIDLYRSMQQHMTEDQSRSIDELLNRILAEPDAGSRAKLFVRIERLLTASHSLLFLYRRALRTAFHPSVRGISLESLGWVRFRDLWFK